MYGGDQVDTVMPIVDIVLRVVMLERPIIAIVVDRVEADISGRISSEARNVVVPLGDYQGVPHRDVQSHLAVFLHRDA